MDDPREMVSFHLFLHDTMAGDSLDDLENLRQADVSVRLSDPLSVLRERAADVFGDSVSHPYWQFVTRTEERGRRQLLPPPIVVIAQDGGYTWPNSRYDNVTVGDLLRANEGGLFDGDPQAVVFEVAPWGNGQLATWQELLEWLQSLLPLVGAGTLGALGGDLWRAIRGRFAQWRSRGAESPVPWLFSVLEKRVWRPAELAERLKVPEDVAIQILESLGHKPVEGSEGALYVRSDRAPDSSLRNEIIQKYLSRDPSEPPQNIDPSEL